jgi:hypothetical protein
MKYNKWTIGLAALGVVSLSSVARADEKPSTLISASSTVLSGYVDTSMQWNPGTGDSHAPDYKYGGAGKADGFNLDVVELTLEKPLDEQDWAAGYKFQLWLGPDANVLGTTSTGVHSDLAIKNAYVNLRAPIGTGLDFKVGVFDSIIGYESSEAINNPNFTRSWGHTFEPSEHTGVLATYRINNMIAFSAGVADTESPGINSRANPPAAESYKTYMASVALTAPDDWGFLAGSSLYSGVVNGFDSAVPNGTANAGVPQTSFYAGATISTPVTGLRFGASFDYATTEKEQYTGAAVAVPSFTAHSFAGYVSYQATEKLSFHGRLEYADLSGAAASELQELGDVGIASSVFSATGTVQYDLWKNVLSRVEVRWDHALDGTDSFGGTTTSAAGFNNQSGHITTGTLQNAFTIAANIIYKF